MISFQHKFDINTLYGSQRWEEKGVISRPLQRTSIFASAITSAACAVYTFVLYFLCVSVHTLMQNRDLGFSVFMMKMYHNFWNVV